jgi:hypothetical protein
MPPCGHCSPGLTVSSTSQCPTGMRTVFSPHAFISSKSTAVIKAPQCFWNALLAFTCPRCSTQSHSETVLPQPIECQVRGSIHGSTTNKEPRFTPRMGLGGSQAALSVVVYATRQKRTANMIRGLWHSTKYCWYRASVFWSSIHESCYKQTGRVVVNSEQLVWYSHHGGHHLTSSPGRPWLAVRSRTR